MFGQIEATGRNVTGNVGQKWPNFGYFAWTKMGGFGKILDLTFIGTIPGPGDSCYILKRILIPLPAKKRKEHLSEHGPY